MLRKIGGVLVSVKNYVPSVPKSVQAAMLAAGVLAITTMPSYAVMEIPDVGVDVVELTGLAITAMGLVAAASICGYAAFLLIKKGVKWLGKALG